MVVPGLSFVSVAVGASVEISGSSSWSWGGQWAALCFEVAGWDCVGCAVWLYVLGCPEAGTVFPDGEALEGRRCWEVDRAVLVKGLPYLSPQCSDFQLVDFPDCGLECGHA